MIYPLVLDLAVDGVPVAVALRVLGFSKQAFFKWRAAPVSQRDWDQAHLINTAMDAHRDDLAFGYRSWPTSSATPAWRRRGGSGGCALATTALVVVEEVRLEPEGRASGA